MKILIPWSALFYFTVACALVCWAIAANDMQTKMVLLVSAAYFEAKTISRLEDAN